MSIHYPGPALLRPMISLALMAVLVACAAPASTPTADPTDAASTPTDAASTPLAADPRLAEIIDNARQEGHVTYQGSDPILTSTPEMERAMADLVLNQFGVEITVTHDHTLNFPASVAKVLDEMAAGTPPTLDLMMQTPASGLGLFAENAVMEVPWLDLFPYITEDDLIADGLAVVGATEFFLPAYHTQLLDEADIPADWDDFLDSKYRGRLGMVVNADPWIFLAQPDAWGLERTLDYLEQLVTLTQPLVGRFPEIDEFLLSGETPILWGQLHTRAEGQKAQGAPVEVLYEVQPALLWVHSLLIPEGSPNANAAILLAAALMSPEGQQFFQDHMNMSSAFRPDTPAAEAAAEIELLTPDVAWMIENGAEVAERVQAIMLTD